MFGVVVSVGRWWEVNFSNSVSWICVVVAAEVLACIVSLFLHERSWKRSAVWRLARREVFRVSVACSWHHCWNVGRVGSGWIRADSEVALCGDRVGELCGSREGHAGGLAVELCRSNSCAMFWGCTSGPHCVASWESWCELSGWQGL